MISFGERQASKDSRSLSALTDFYNLWKTRAVTSPPAHRSAYRGRSTPYSTTSRGTSFKRWRETKSMLTMLMFFALPRWSHDNCPSRHERFKASRWLDPSFIQTSTMRGLKCPMAIHTHIQREGEELQWQSTFNPRLRKEKKSWTSNNLECAKGIPFSLPRLK